MERAVKPELLGAPVERGPCLKPRAIRPEGEAVGQPVEPVAQRYAPPGSPAPDRAKRCRIGAVHLVAIQARFGVGLEVGEAVGVAEADLPRERLPVFRPELFGAIEDTLDLGDRAVSGE
ncbi:MAG: hypothetical protein M5T61_09545 [Acidimicrobiia bacterium]|nr:hypothetical protein [Acidimicrobiia bacterium]